VTEITNSVLATRLQQHFAQLQMANT